jgi:hypothetical protein
LRKEDLLIALMRDGGSAYPEIKALFKDVNHPGVTSTEWDGHTVSKATFGFGQVKAWQDMCARLSASQTSELSNTSDLHKHRTNAAAYVRRKND